MLKVLTKKTGIFIALLISLNTFAEQVRHHHNGILIPYEGEPPHITLTDKDKKKLQKEKAVYKKIDIEGAKRGIAVFRVNAKADIIWSVIRDFKSYPDWIEDIQQTHIYKQQDGNIFVRFNAENKFAGDLVWHIHHDYPVTDRNWGSWRMDYNYSSDLDDSVGFWRVLPVADAAGMSDVIYSADLKLKQKVPSFVVSLIVKSRLKQATQWVKEQSEIRSGAHWRKLKAEIKTRFPESAHITLTQYEKDWQGKSLLVDVREREEYDISHIPGAIHSQDTDTIARLAAGRPVVVYCSVGYRSAKMTEKLSRKGMQAVNLEGSIFEWANSDRSLVGHNGKQVKFVHPFDKEWGIYLQEEYRAELSD